jgi:uncharacterized protein (DUF427 family)
MRVRFGGAWIADSEDIMLLHEPGRYPVAYFPLSDIADGVLEHSKYTTRHPDLGATSWYSVRAGGRARPRAAWQHTELPTYASELRGRAALRGGLWDALYEEDERIVAGHAADFYHRIDTRQASRHLIVRDGRRVVAGTTGPLALYESGFAPRWYVPGADLDKAVLTAAHGQTFCPYKGLASYYDIGDAHRAASSYEDAWTEARRISGLVSFEPDKIAVYRDGTRLRLEPGQTVFRNGIDRDLPLDDVIPGRQP